MGTDTTADEAIPAEASHFLDLNGDGKVDYEDALHALKIAGVTVSAAATAVGVTAATSAAAGAALVSSTAASMGTSIAAAGGAVVGTVAGLSAGTSTIGVINVVQVGSAMLVESATLSSVSSGVVGAWAGTTSAFAASAEIASGYIAGLPIVKAAAVSSLKSAGEVVVIGGIVFSVKAAIATGLVMAVLAAGVVYYVLTKEAEEKIESGTLEA